MRKKNRLFLFLLGALGLGLAGAFAVGKLSTTKLALVLSLGGAGGLFYIGYRQKLFTQIADRLEAAQPQSYEDSWTEKEARGFIDEWSEEEFTLRGSIDFRWDTAEFTSDEVVNSDGDREIIYAHWTDFGEANKKIIVYTNGTQKRLLSYRLIKPGEVLEHPYEKCSYWKTRQRFMRYRAAASIKSGQSGAGSQQQSVGGAIPIDEFQSIDNSQESSG